MSTQAEFLYRGKSFIFRGKVPEDLISYFGAKEVEVPLDAPDRQTAEQMFALEQQEMERKFADARRRREVSRIGDAFAQDFQRAAEQVFHQEIERYRASAAHNHSWRPERVKAKLDKEMGKWTDGLHHDRWSKEANKAVKELLADQGIVMPPQSGAFPEARRSIVRAIASANRVAALEAEGETVEAFNGTMGIPSVPSIVSDFFQPAVLPDYANLTVAQLIELFLAEKRPLWSSPLTELNYLGIVRVLKEVLGQDHKVRTITRVDCLKIREFIRSVPTNVRLRYPGLSLREASRKCREDDGERLSPKTQRGYLIALSQIFNWAVDQWFMEKNPASGLAEKNLKIKRTFMQSPFTIDQLQAVFASPLFTGCANDGRGFNRPGPHIIRRARFWVPLIALWTGMRLTEICQLETEDIQAKSDVDCIVVSSLSKQGRNRTRKSIKTEAGERLIPIHPELKRLGFLDYVKKMRDHGEAALLAMSLSLLKFVGQASLVDDAMLPS